MREITPNEVSKLYDCIGKILQHNIATEIFL